MSADPRVCAAVEQALRDSGVDWEAGQPGQYVVSLPGEKKLKTVTALVVGDHAFTVEAFVVRRPDENAAEFYRFLLGRNSRMYGMGFATDRVGDVFLVGHLPLHGVTAEEVDRLLGCVVSYVDETFDRALEIGFATAIRREWAWRVERGESLDNLRAFASFASRASGQPEPDDD